MGEENLTCEHAFLIGNQSTGHPLSPGRAWGACGSFPGPVGGPPVPLALRASITLSPWQGEAGGAAAMVSLATRRRQPTRPAHGGVSCHRCAAELFQGPHLSLACTQGSICARLCTVSHVDSPTVPTLKWPILEEGMHI